MFSQTDYMSVDESEIVCDWNSVNTDRKDIEIMSCVGPSFTTLVSVCFATTFGVNKPDSWPPFVLNFSLNNYQ